MLETKVDENTKRIGELFDKFIIIDRKKLYSCGVSFKDIGKKCFTINEFNNKEYLDKIIHIIS